MKNLPRVNLTMYRKQAGYTLIEFMVAGVLGLILLLGVMQIYLGATQTNRLQAGVIEVQDSGRFALSFLEKDIQRAGWSNLDPGINLGTLDTHIDFANSTNASGYNSSDSLTIQYEADDEAGVNNNYNCGGDLIPPGDLIINEYRVDAGSLLCNDRQLLSNVETLQFVYGAEDTGQLTDGIVDIYLRADEIGGYEETVVTVRVALLLRSTNDVLDSNNTNAYQVFEFPFAAVNDKKLRRLFNKTILLPNRPKAF
ncbi:MAG: type IV pilus assembly protein PilW [Enterobacterales bacterium]|jgi:type IV pilus assembly protein PilW